MKHCFSTGLVVLCAALSCVQNCRAEEALIHDTAAYWEMAGEVVDGKEKPVAGVEILAVGYQDPFRQETVTNARGEYRLRIPQSASAVLIRADDKKGGRRGYRSMAEHNLTRFEPVPIVLKPVREVMILVVTETGQPVPGASISVDQGSFPLAEVETKQDGMARVELVEVEASNSSSIQAIKAGVGYDYSSARTAQGGLNLDFALGRTLKLTLRKARTVRLKLVDGNQKPISGVSVELTSLKAKGNGLTPSFGSMSQKSSKTNDDGIAEYDWVPAELDGPVWLRSHSKEFAPAEDDVVTLQSGTEQTVVPFARKVRVAGRVLTPDGKPATKARILVRSFGVRQMDRPQILQTSEEGRFETLLPSHRACMLFAESGDLVAEKTGLILHEGKTIDELELRLAPGCAVTGLWTRGKSNQPAGGQTVQLIRTGLELPEELGKLAVRSLPTSGLQNFSWVTQTDANGGYRFVVTPGEYAVRRALSWGDGSPLKVGAMRESVHDFHDEYEMVPFTGSVVDPRGEGIEGALMEKIYRPEESEQDRRLKLLTTSRGKFEGKRLHVPFALMITSHDRKLALVVKENNEDVYRYELQPLSTIRGRIVDSDGNPKKNIGVKCTPVLVNAEKPPFMLLKWGKTAQTDEDGKFEVSGLATGVDWQFSYEIKPNSYVKFRDVSLIEPGDLDLGEAVKRGP